MTYFEDGLVKYDLASGSKRIVIPRDTATLAYFLIAPTPAVDDIVRISAWFDYWLRDTPYLDPARERAYDAWRERQDGRATARETPAASTEKAE